MSDLEDLDRDDADAALAEAITLLEQAQERPSVERIGFLLTWMSAIEDQTLPLPHDLTEPVFTQLTLAVEALAAGARDTAELSELVGSSVLSGKAVVTMLHHPACTEQLMFDLADRVRYSFGHLKAFEQAGGTARRLALLSPLTGVELHKARPVLDRWAKLPAKVADVAETLVTTWTGTLDGFIDVAEATAA